jgi:hypothetical protein
LQKYLSRLKLQPAFPLRKLLIHEGGGMEENQVRNPATSNPFFKINKTREQIWENWYYQL